MTATLSAVTTPTATRPRRALPLILAAVVVVILAVGGGVFYFATRSLDVRGTVRLYDPDMKNTDGKGGCAGSGDFEDLRSDMQVVVSDPAGTVLAVGRLGPGTWESDGVCRFTFKVSAPAGKGNYGLQLGQRDVVRYSESELSSPLSLTIGDKP